MEERNRRLTFRKKERLCSRKSIEFLFQHGQILISFPLRMVYIRKKDTSAPLPKVLISVSRKHFRKAAGRNYIKRILREAYRKNKHILVDYAEAHEESIELAIIYASGRMPEPVTLEKNIKDLLQKLVKDFEETGEISVKSK